MGRLIDYWIRRLINIERSLPMATSKERIEDFKALEGAIDTLRKYQKIQAYMEKLEKNGQYGTLRKLKIVLEETE